VSCLELVVLGGRDLMEELLAIVRIDVIVNSHLIMSFRRNLF
jgi:hypothetical protein